jgi:hypothetical protein
MSTPGSGFWRHMSPTTLRASSIWAASDLQPASATVAASIVIPT